MNLRTWWSRRGAGLGNRVLPLSLIAVFFLFGVRTAPAAAAEPVEMKVGISARVMTVFPLWMAQAGGFYKQQGLEVQIIDMGGGTRGIQVLLSGDIQAMHVGLGPVIQADTQGADLRIISSTSNTIPFTVFSPPGVKTAADIKGHSVGISRFGSESDIAVTLALKQLGLTRKDVNIIQIGGSSTRLAALMSGQVKAVPLIDPATTKARELGMYPLMDLAAAHVPWVFDSIVVRESYLRSHRPLLTRFLKAYIEGAYLTLSDEKRADEVIAQVFKTDNRKVIDASYRDFKRLMPLDAEPSRAGAANVIEQLRAIGLKVGSANVDDYLDTSIIESLKKDGYLPALQRKYHLQ